MAISDAAGVVRGEAPTRSLPRIDDDQTSEPFEVAAVAGGDGHAVDEGGGADEAVAKRVRVGPMDTGGPADDRLVDGQDALGESGGDAFIQPGAKLSAVA